MKIDLEQQFELYLKRAGLNSSTVSYVQYVETKRAFMGACGAMLIIFRDEIGSIESEEEAVNAMADLYKQVSDYWTKEADLK